MLYVEQSLTGNEKILLVGKFHWIYLISAVFWIVLGVLACTGIIGGGVAWTVHRAMDAGLPNLPRDLFWQGWHDTVGRLGGYVAIIQSLNVIVRVFAFGVLILGILLFAHMMIVRATTEIAVTSTRLVLKEGILSRLVDEMDIDRIESVHVIQSILGRMLNFGTVMVRGMGIGEIVLPPLMDPIGFRNAIEKAKQLGQGGPKPSSRAPSKSS